MTSAAHMHSLLTSGASMVPAARSTPVMNRLLVHAKASTSVDTTLDSALDELELCAKQADSPPWPADQKAAFKEGIRRHPLIGEQAPQGVHFLVVECGRWKDSYPELQAVAGQPARALVCFFKVPYVVTNGSRCDGLGLDHFIFVLDLGGCFPSGAVFSSATRFEDMTTKYRTSQYIKSCFVLHQGRPVGSIQKWLKRSLPGYRTVSKLVTKSSFHGTGVAAEQAGARSADEAGGDELGSGGGAA